MELCSSGQFILARPKFSFSGKFITGNMGFRIRCKNRDFDNAPTRQRARKRQLKYEAMESYRTRFTKAVCAELSEEMQAMEDRMRNWSRQRLENEGFALFNLSASFDTYLYRDPVFRFHHKHGNGVLPLNHQFRQGDMVLISRRTPLNESEEALEGVVMERSQRFLRVAVQKSVAKSLNIDHKWRLDLWANRIAYDRCLSAIEQISSPKFEREKSLDNRDEKNRLEADNSHLFGDAASTVKILIEKLEEPPVQLAGSNKMGFPNTEHVIAASKPPSQIGKTLSAFKNALRDHLKDVEGQLNSSQCRAIQEALCRKVTLWQGPPGTGKTRTLVELINIYCKTGQGKVLACADSNVAVDNLVEGLLVYGLRIVRIGQPVKVKEELRQATLEAQVVVHPLMKRSLQLKRESKSQRAESRMMNGSKRSTIAKEASLKWDNAVDLERQAIKSVLERAEVVASTCVGVGDERLEGCRFTLCVIDEASQATEPASLIPILNSGANSLILVGDQAQLPPTVVSKDALEAGLGISLFERLQQCGLTTLLLNMQYRMHPALAEFPSNMFYKGNLLSYPSPMERPAPKGYHWPNEDRAIVFIDCVYGKEESTSQGFSWKNCVEAQEVVRIVKRLIAGGNDITCSEIGVITPYNAQVRLLHDLFAEEGDFAGLEIKSVDGFQGREKEVIILCLVRSNLDRQLGFVTDPRRINVALTRARRGLIVLGNSKTLDSNLYWRSWMDYMKHHHLWVSHTII